MKLAQCVFGSYTDALTEKSQFLSLEWTEMAIVRIIAEVQTDKFSASWLIYKHFIIFFPASFHTVA